MTLEVLRNRRQIDEARSELARRGLSFVSPGWMNTLRRFKAWPGISFGDEIKSWDVLKTVQFIESNIDKPAAILDIGAFASEVPLILHRLGYTNITGLDLNPDIVRMPFADKVDYRVGNFLKTPFPDASVDVVTAISVIEHGLDMDGLTAEMARILRPGGVFLASFDYWPDKIDTGTITMFGMSWTIFSRDDVGQFVAKAGERGLVPCGELAFDGGDRPISCAGRDYTFGWLALRRAV